MDKPALRSTLKNLRAIPFDRDVHAYVMMAPQEMLDFLALLEGIKPVFLLGRGFDDPQWIEGVVALAAKKKLHMIEGPPWKVRPISKGFPAWFRGHLEAQEEGGVNTFICRTAATAEAVRATFEGAALTEDEEARLLGYPSCCVREHYDRAEMLDKLFYMLVERTGRGEPEEMKRILHDDVEMAVETPEETELHKRATEFMPAPYTSFHMCAACAANPQGTALAISKRYEDLARSVDEGLAAEIAQAQHGVGR